MKRPLLQLSQVTITIQQRPLCQALSLDIYPGETWGILSPNGGGKTTLLHTLAGLHPPTDGDILLNQVALPLQPIKTVAQHISLLFQETTAPFPQTVWEYCLASRYPHLPYFQPESDTDKRIVTEALQTMELTHLAHRSLQRLSGGEKRRAAIAAVLSQTPRIYLLDEPTNHLDLRHQQKALMHFQHLAQHQQATVIMALHDINLAQQFCQRILMLLPEGDVLHGKTNDILTSENLSMLYQHPMTHIPHRNTSFWHPA